MNQLSGIAKRLALPVLLVGALIGVQVVRALPPSPGFDFEPDPPIACEQVNFTSTAVDPESDPMTIEWDFDYDNVTFTPDATGSSVSNTYTTPGTRTVAQRATDGGIDLPLPPATKNVAVGNNVPPTASVSPALRSAGVGQSLLFTGNGSDPRGAVTNFRWDFDGQPGFEVDPAGATNTVNHTYTAPGDYTVGLEVTDNCGATTAAQGLVTVTNAPPIPRFTISPNPAKPTDLVRLDASTSSDTGGPIANFRWNLDGNETFEVDPPGAVSFIERTFPVGVHIIELEVTDSNQETRTLQHTLRVNGPPSAGFTYTPLTPLIGEQITFDATATSDGGTIPNSGYQWDFDYVGTTFTVDATGDLPTRSFATKGTKRVALRVTDSNGAVTVVPTEIEVQETKPTAGLRVSPSVPIPGQRITLTSTSTPSGGPALPKLERTEWDFNYAAPVFTVDAVGSSIATSFPTPGLKSIAVRVYETGGGFDIRAQLLLVNAPPRASFTRGKAVPINGDEVNFISTSDDPDGNIVKHEWDFEGDGKWDATGNVVSKKLTKASYAVTLRVTDSHGARATTSQAVAVKAKPLKDPLDPRKLLYYVRQKWGVKFERLVVKPVPRKATVAVSCKGQGCRRGTFRKRSKKNGSRLQFKQLEGALRAGAKVIVVTTRPGHIGQHVTYVIRGKRRDPVMRERCFWSNPKKLRACP
jgi:PKD repeat protein